MVDDVNKQEGSLDSFIRETINELLGEFSHLLNNQPMQPWFQQKKKLDEKDPDEKDLFALLDLLLELLHLLMRGPELTQGSHAGANQWYFEGLKESVEDIRSTFNPTAGGPAQAASSSGFPGEPQPPAGSPAPAAPSSAPPNSSGKPQQPTAGGPAPTKPSDAPPEPEPTHKPDQVYMTAFQGLSAAEAKRLYRLVALKVHPDKCPDKKDAAEVEFKALGEEYEKHKESKQPGGVKNIDAIFEEIKKHTKYLQPAEKEDPSAAAKKESTANKEPAKTSDGAAKSYTESQANKESSAKTEFGGNQGPAKPSDGATDDPVEKPCDQPPARPHPPSPEPSSNNSDKANNEPEYPIPQTKESKPDKDENVHGNYGQGNG